jgi:hypothetical protein
MGIFNLNTNRVQLDQSVVEYMNGLAGKQKRWLPEVGQILQGCIGE